MTALLLEPHADDACLFAAWTCLRHQPLVITVLSSQVQEDRGTGITNAQRVAENREALSWLGCHVEQWDFPDSAPDWEAIGDRLAELPFEPEVVFAPAWEEGGHEQHNALANVALGVVGPERVRPYLTYRRGHTRTVGKPVPYERLWPMLKLRALSCFESQIAEPTTAPWFLDGIREFVPA